MRNLMVGWSIALCAALFAWCTGSFPEQNLSAAPLLAANPASQVAYRVNDIDPNYNLVSGQLNAGNNRGVFVGVGLIANVDVGFIATSSGLQSIDVPPRFLPRDINSHGVMTGVIRTGGPTQDAAVLVFPDGTTQYLGDLGGMVTAPLALNDRNEVVGQALTAAGEGHAFYWSYSSGLIDLSEALHASASGAYDINNRSVVVGYYGHPTTGAPKAFLWSPRTGAMALDITAVDDPNARSIATAINDRGDIVGAFGQPQTGHYRAFHRSRDGVVREPPLNADLPTDIYAQTIATTLNEHGVVVGIIERSGEFAHAFVWNLSEGNAVLPSIGLGGDDPTAVLDDGTIAGFSHATPAVSRPALWTPVR